jgi:hypothetical protein
MTQTSLSKLEEYRLYLRQTALDSLYYMATAVLGFKDLTPEVHLLPCMFISDDSINSKGWLDPRGFFKSSIVQSRVVQRISANQNHQMLYVSEVDDNAERCLKFVSQTIEGNGFYRWLFPEVQLAQASSQRLRVKRPKAAADDTLVAVGVGSSIASQHYDEIFSDDWFAEKAKDSEGARERAIEFRRRLVPILKPGGFHLTTGTRWDFKDGYKWIGENEPHTKWLIRSAIQRDGTALFPKFYDLAKLAEIRRTQGEYLFSCLYLNRPEGDSGHRLQTEWLKPYSVDGRKAFALDTPSEGVPFSAMAKYIMIDPSPGTNDEQAYVIWGVWRDKGGKIYYFLLHEDTTDGLTLSGQLRHAFRLAFQWRCIGMGIQRVTESMYFYQLAKEAIQQEHLGIFVKQVKTPGGNKFSKISVKAQRIISLVEPPASAGQIYISDVLRLGKFYSQYRNMPLPQEHDDIVDAASLIFSKEETNRGNQVLAFPPPGFGYNDGECEEDEEYIDPAYAQFMDRVRQYPTSPMSAY